MSRKEVIKLLKLIKSTVYLGNRKFFDALELAINYLNQSEPQWIPCSERMPDHPENNDYYLVTIQKDADALNVNMREHHIGISARTAVQRWRRGKMYDND